uniref:PDZ domain-containing protein n=1 Tax=Scleropages formosus TaxID=113540 RepID=A0A8C9QXL8_SCLFO
MCRRLPYINCCCLSCSGKMVQRYGGLPGELHMIELEKGEVGLGLSLAGNSDHSRMSVFVAAVDPRGAAGQDGRISVGDELLEINGQILYGRSHQNASSIIKSAPSKVKIIFTRYVDGSTSRVCHHLPSSSSPSSVSGANGSSGPPAPNTFSSNPATCPITPGCETTIKVCKGHNGLGLSIVGGRDTLLGAIVIHEVYEDGAAFKDGRLRAGDQILEVNGFDLRETTHDEAIEVLRQTVQDVLLTVYRREACYNDVDLWDIFTLELDRESGQDLGLRVAGKRDDRGVFVSDIVEGGLVEMDGQLRKGDQILSVNGVDVRVSTEESVVALLKVSLSPSGNGKLRFPVTLYGTRGSENVCVETGSYEDGPTNSLGISVAGGVGSSLGDVPIFVATMHPAGLAAQSQALEVGDQILSINGVSAEGLSHTEVDALLERASGNIELDDFADSLEENIMVGFTDDPRYGYTLGQPHDSLLHNRPSSASQFFFVWDYEDYSGTVCLFNRIKYFQS